MCWTRSLAESRQTPELVRPAAWAQFATTVPKPAQSLLQRATGKRQLDSTRSPLRSLLRRAQVLAACKSADQAAALLSDSKHGRYKDAFLIHGAAAENVRTWFDVG